MKFYKNEFMEYMENNFVLDSFSRGLLESIVDYGEANCKGSKETLVNFICDIIANVEYIEYEEIEQFYKKEQE